MQVETDISLEYFCTYRARLKAPVDAGAGPFGQRLFFEVIDGELEADGVKGTLLSGGGDWLLVGPDGWGRLDVRAQVRLDDGAVIYASYHGYLELNEQVQRWLTDDEGTSFSDQYFRTSPRFETGDQRYAALTRTLFVSEGRFLTERTVEYQTYRVI
jgi:hypothetical protein